MPVYLLQKVQCPTPPEKEEMSYDLNTFCLMKESKEEGKEGQEGEGKKEGRMERRKSQKPEGMEDQKRRKHLSFR